MPGAGAGESRKRGPGAFVAHHGRPAVAPPQETMKDRSVPGQQEIGHVHSSRKMRIFCDLVFPKWACSHWRMVFSVSGKTLEKEWRPQPDLNRRRRRERAVSLAGLDDGDAQSGEPSRSRTCDPLIKSQMLYQLSYGLPRKTFMVKAGKRECQARNGFFRRMVWFRSAPTEISETSTPASSSSLRTYF
jgi:hypothetical protein